MNMDAQPNPRNYAEALEVLGKYNARKIANNTYLEKFDAMFHDSVPSIGIRLHGTYVVKFYANGTTELNSGGYRTVTTKDRMNRYLPFGARIWQQDGTWYYYAEGETDSSVIFRDDMAIDSETGAVLTPFQLGSEATER